MCPACITTAVIIAASTGSTGAAAALLRKKMAALRRPDLKSGQAMARVSSQTQKENHYGRESRNAA
jgi:hypothetical protein